MLCAAHSSLVAYNVPLRAPSSLRSNVVMMADMSQTQVLQFMQKLSSVPVADKVAFLKSKGVSATAIEQAVCVSPLDRFGPVQGHPGEGPPVGEAAAPAAAAAAPAMSSALLDLSYTAAEARIAAIVDAEPAHARATRSAQLPVHPVRSVHH